MTAAPPSGLFFEDLDVGAIFDGPGVTVTQDAIIRFALEWDMQPFHVDVTAAGASAFGTLVASGLHTLLLTYRLYLDTGLLRGTALAGLGMDEVRFVRPVKPGDTIAVRTEIVDRKPTRKSERGAVVLRLSSFDAAGELVFSMLLKALVARRPSG